MNPINLHLTLADGSTVDTMVSAPDFVAFETKFDKSIQSFSTDVRITYLFFLAWNSLKRTGKTDLDFDAWVETAANVEVVEQKK